MFSNFICDKCGACCETLVVEAYWADAVREPLLLDANPGMTLKKLRSAERCIVLYDCATKRCPFLNATTKLCHIYPTRPFCCVTIEAGDAKCQQARVLAGLPLRRDRGGNEISEELLRQSCMDYELDFDEWFAETAR